MWWTLLRLWRRPNPKTGIIVARVSDWAVHKLQTSLLKQSGLAHAPPRQTQTMQCVFVFACLPGRPSTCWVAHPLSQSVFTTLGCESPAWHMHAIWHWTLQHRRSIHQNHSIHSSVVPLPMAIPLPFYCPLPATCRAVPAWVTAEPNIL